MKNTTKAVVFTILVVALAPFAGFWIVALLGAGLLFLPISAMISAFFPKAWRHIEDGVLTRTRLLPTT